MFNLHTDNNESFLDSFLYGPSKYFNLSEYNKHLIYTNNLIEDSSVDHSFADNGIEYTLNKKNYRSPEFVKGTDILFAGCSLTWGAGVPEKNIWSSVVAKNLNLSYANVALSGDSVYGQVKRIFAYFKEFGHPKYLYALFPEFYRMPIIVNKKLFTTSAKIDPSDPNLMQNAFIPGNIEKDFKVAIRPFIAEQILSPEFPHFLSAQSLNMLEAYCEVAGIKFAWSTWDQKQFLVLKQLKGENYKTLVDIEMQNWSIDYDTIEDRYLKDGQRVLCHEELRSSGPKYFDLGSDSKYGIRNAHWGSHRHQHVAEIATSYLKDWIK